MHYSNMKTTFEVNKFTEKEKLIYNSFDNVVRFVAMQNPSDLYIIRQYQGDNCIGVMKARACDEQIEDFSKIIITAW